VHRAGAGGDHPITALVAVLPGDGPHSVPQPYTTLKGWLRERAIDARTRLSDIAQRRRKEDRRFVAFWPLARQAERSRGPDLWLSGQATQTPSGQDDQVERSRRPGLWLLVTQIRFVVSGPPGRKVTGTRSVVIPDFLWSRRPSRKVTTTNVSARKGNARVKPLWIVGQGQ
jgi:hypothetical protein